MKENLIRAKIACAIARTTNTNQELVLSVILDIEEQRVPNTPASIMEIATKKLKMSTSLFRKTIHELSKNDLLVKKEGLIQVNRKYITL